MTHKAAWAAYTATPEFTDLSIRATHYNNVEASLEAAFAAGRAGALEEAAKIAEDRFEQVMGLNTVSRDAAVVVAAAIRTAKEQP